MKSAILAFLASPFVVSAAPIPTSKIYDGPPPARYFAVRMESKVGFGMIDKCGTPPEGKYFKGCVRGRMIYLPNPCLHLDQDYAVVLCHELAHRQGWPGTHGG